jgi:hypothetical protein
MHRSLKHHIQTIHPHLPVAPAPLLLALISAFLDLGLLERTNEGAPASEDPVDGTNDRAHQHALGSGGNPEGEA